MQFQNINNSSYTSESSTLNILYYADVFKSVFQSDFGTDSFSLKESTSLKNLAEETQNLSINDLNLNLFIEVSPDTASEVFQIIENIKNHWLARNIIIILFLTEENDSITTKHRPGQSWRTRCVRQSTLLLVSVSTPNNSVRSFPSIPTA